MQSIRNTSKRAHIIPFMNDLDGLLPPGEVLLNVPKEAAECSLVQGAVAIGELVVEGEPEAVQDDQNDDTGEDDQDDNTGEDKAALLTQCELLGIDVSKRWSAKRLRTEIDAVAANAG